MDNKISIFITGNPHASSGSINIGSIGTGLKLLDTGWPSTSAVMGNYALTVTDDVAFSTYCLIIRPSLITSEGSNRSGVLNFQMRLPLGHSLMNLATNSVEDPLTVLLRLFNEFRSRYMQVYPGVEGMSFKADASMTEADLEEFLNDYMLKREDLPNRYLNGSGDAVVALPEEKLKQLLANRAYPELTRYNRLILTEMGATTASLSRLQIPRTPRYDIFINGQKQPQTVGDGDAPFTLTVQPPNSYQLPAQVNVDINEARSKGLIDTREERINYHVFFADKEESRVYRIQLQGDKSAAMLEKIIKSLDFKAQVPFGREQILSGKPSVESKTVTLRLKGGQLDMNWEPVLKSPLPNVTGPYVNLGVDGQYTVLFTYKKPEPVATPVSGPNLDWKGSNEQQIDIPVSVVASGGMDVEMIRSMQQLHFNLHIPLTSGELVIPKVKCGKSKSSNGYSASVRVPRCCLDFIKTSGQIQAIPDDADYELKASIDGKGDKPFAIKIVASEAERPGAFGRVMRSRGAQILLTALILFIIGWVSRGFFIEPESSPAPPLTSGEHKPTGDNGSQNNVKAYMTMLEEGHVTKANLDSINSFIVQNEGRRSDDEFTNLRNANDLYLKAYDALRNPSKETLSYLISEVEKSKLSVLSTRLSYLKEGNGVSDSRIQMFKEKVHDFASFDQLDSLKNTSSSASPSAPAFDAQAFNKKASEYVGRMNQTDLKFAEIAEIRQWVNKYNGVSEANRSKEFKKIKECLPAYEDAEKIITSLKNYPEDANQRGSFVEDIKEKVIDFNDTYLSVNKQLQIQFLRLKLQRLAYNKNQTIKLPNEDIMDVIEEFNKKVSSPTSIGDIKKLKQK